MLGSWGGGAQQSRQPEEQKQERGRAPAAAEEQEQGRGRAPAAAEEQEQERGRVPAAEAVHTVCQEWERRRGGVLGLEWW